MARVLIETIKEKANLLENKLEDIESQIKKANTPQIYVSASDLWHHWKTLMELFKNRKRKVSSLNNKFKSQDLPTVFTKDKA